MAKTKKEKLTKPTKESSLKLEIPIDGAEIALFIKSYKETKDFPTITTDEQILDVFASTVAFIQFLIFEKSGGKFAVDFVSVAEPQKTITLM